MSAVNNLVQIPNLPDFRKVVERRNEPTCTFWQKICHLFNQTRPEPKIERLPYIENLQLKPNEKVIEVGYSPDERSIIRTFNKLSQENRHLLLDKGKLVDKTDKQSIWILLKLLKSEEVRDKDQRVIKTIKTTLETLFQEQEQKRRAERDHPNNFSPVAPVINIDRVRRSNDMMRVEIIRDEIIEQETYESAIEALEKLDPQLIKINKELSDLQTQINEERRKSGIDSPISAQLLQNNRATKNRRRHRLSDLIGAYKAEATRIGCAAAHPELKHLIAVLESKFQNVQHVIVGNSPTTHEDYQNNLSSKKPIQDKIDYAKQVMQAIDDGQFVAKPPVPNAAIEVNRFASAAQPHRMTTANDLNQKDLDKRAGLLEINSSKDALKRAQDTFKNNENEIAKLKSEIADAKKTIGNSCDKDRNRILAFANEVCLADKKHQNTLELLKKEKDSPYLQAKIERANKTYEGAKERLNKEMAILQTRIAKVESAVHKKEEELRKREADTEKLKELVNVSLKKLGDLEATFRTKYHELPHFAKMPQPLATREELNHLDEHEFVIR